MRTWHFELAAVAVVLLGFALLSGGGWVEFVGAGAVVLSFAHVQVADRLAEGEAARTAKMVEVAGVRGSPHVVKWTERQRDHTVHCHAWATRYLVGKELLWLAYFVALGAWSALAGVAIFLAYPVWRAWWSRL